MAVFTPVADPAFTWPLSAPVFMADAKIEEISFRKPTGLDLMMVGNPVKMTPYGGAEDAVVDYRLAYAMLERLSGVPIKVLQTIDPAEATELFWVMGTFFTPGLQTIYAAKKNSQAPASAPQEQPESSPGSTPASPS